MSPDQGLEIWFGDVCLDTENRALRGKSGVVQIDRRACDVLIALIESRDRALRRDEILERVWPPGAAVAPGSVTVQVHALRAAFRRVGCQLEPIRTMRAPARYQFCLDLTEAPARDPPQPPQPVVRPETAFADGPAVTLPRRRMPIAGWAAIIGLAGLIGFAGSVWVAGAKRPPPRSLAVEPFTVLGSDPGGRALATAVTAGIVAGLAQAPSIRIAAGPDAAALAGRTPQVIGEALRVRYVLEGSLSAEAGQLHVNFGLIESASGVQLDAGSFSQPSDKVQQTAQLIVRRVISRMPKAPE